jgi:O-antigen/teichoic acid export membrane protein
MTNVRNNYIFSLLLTGFNILFPIISFPYVAQVLGAVGVGKVQFILSFAQYFALLAALGIPFYGARLIAQASHDQNLLYKTLSELVYIHIICSLIVSAIYLVIIMSFPFFDRDRSLYFFAGVFILMGFSSIDWYFAGIENFRLIAIRSVAVKLVSLVALYLFVQTSNDYNIYLFISIFAILGNNIINIWSVRKFIKLSSKGIKRHLRPLMYTFGTTVATSMYTMLDTVLIGMLSNEKSVGLYSASIRLTKISIPVIISAATVLMPRISKLFSLGDFDALRPLLTKSFNFIIILGVPICIGFLLLAPELIFIFSSPEFAAASTTMRILSPLTLIIGLGYFWAFQILIPSGRDRQLLISVMIGMILNLSLNFLLIPTYRQDGAAVANVVSELGVTLCYMYFCFRIIPFRISHKPVLLNLAATIPSILIAFYTRTLNLNVYTFLAVNVISFVVIYFAIQMLFLNRQTLKDLVGDLSKKGAT